jgi:hypothetical protein
MLPRIEPAKALFRPQAICETEAAINPQEQFSIWLEQHQDELFTFELDQERALI